MVTFAPEMPGGVDFAQKIRQESDIVLSIGHTNATYEEAMAAIDAGADHITHTFNAMSALSHRAPGVVGAAFCSDAYCELIADTFHIHPGLFKFFNKTKGDKLVLITDCVRAVCRTANTRWAASRSSSRVSNVVWRMAQLPAAC